MNQPEIDIPADRLLNCPTCALPAEITDRFVLDGVPAPVEHVKLVCIKGHWYTPPVDQLLSKLDAQPREEQLRGTGANSSPATAS